MFPECCFHQRTYVAQGLVNAILSEILTTLVSNLNDLWLVRLV